MLTANSDNENTKFEIDWESHLIRLERGFDARPNQVFEAWTQPEHVARWWDPAGQTLAVCEIDLRPGGAFKFTPKGRSNMPFSGMYLEVAPPQRLTFEALGAIGRVFIDELEHGTRLLVEIQCRSTEHLEQFLLSGIDKGTSVTLDNLVHYMRIRSL
ncbi:hypothetical protein HPO_19168 [Hyphomonas polymorpha PS728]|uniref:Activator of Hsp90 ATPase homologue 1/2-like C-terminal domain-containing protein n=1 Tax=Hyphomonas polymorpha PS728 TaxID=1280954 RepID=A0A062VDN2_9PROT|nr:SRPBCC domain-containing protein [Hyphomonas polymorpha]KCZ96581.1 hypothetical protein HPO_19168 [Hyphomonas polymorpha PS728]